MKSKYIKFSKLNYIIKFCAQQRPLGIAACKSAAKICRLASNGKNLLKDGTDVVIKRNFKKGANRKSGAHSFASAVYAVLLCVSAVISAFSLSMPEYVSVYSESELADSIRIPLVSYVRTDCRDESIPCSAGTAAAAKTASAEPAGMKTASLGDYYTCEAKLFGVIPLGNVDVGVYRDVKVYPGGMSFGVKLTTEGVLIVGMSDVNGADGAINPAYNAGIRIGDAVTAIEGKEIDSVIQMTELLSESEGKALTLTVMRDGETKLFQVTPVFDGESYKIGVWIRDSTAGIGTVTYIIPDTGAFAGLGHGIYDIDTGKLVPLRRGTVNDVIISGIKKGRAGAPGELQGYFGSEKLGTLMYNCDCGVYGVFSEIPECTKGIEPMPIGLSSDITEGDAEILCTLDDSGIKRYSIKIAQISHDDSSTKNFIIEVNDQELINLTGGIIQGISGNRCNSKRKTCRSSNPCNDWRANTRIRYIH